MVADEQLQKELARVVGTGLVNSFKDNYPWSGTEGVLFPDLPDPYALPDVGIPIPVDSILGPIIWGNLSSW